MTMSSQACFYDYPNQSLFLPSHGNVDSHSGYEYEYQHTSQSALPIERSFTFSDAYALTLLQQPANLGLNSEHAQIPNAIPSPAPLVLDTRYSSISSVDTVATPSTWMYPMSMGGPAIQNTQGLKRARSHQRTPSTSTIASNGPASPYTHNWSQPQIANTDFAPNSPAHFAEQAGTGAFSKNLPTFVQTPADSGFMTAGYMPSQAAHTGGAHQAMKGFAIDHHNGEDFAPAFAPSSQYSMSSNGADSPATPPSGAGEQAQNGLTHQISNGNGTEYRQAHPNVQLFRTESAAYQDELYNPPTTTYSSTPTSGTKTATDYLSPHRNLVTERLQTANIARSQSPGSAASRERSPFRDGSPLAPAPAPGWRSPAPGAGVGTAAGMRQQQKEKADQAELAQHMPQLRREPTKTISPKDALLDYNEQEQPSLFQDSIPPGYKQHTGGTEVWPSNSFFSQPGGAFGSLTTPSQQAFANFRATSADGYGGSDAMSFVPLPPSQNGTSQIQHGGSFGNFFAPKLDSAFDTNPQFPAQLTSMESSHSENGPLLSSQESAINTSAPRRPSDTRAATGTYTCTYHGCTQRFDSHANLQKHKRDIHRAQHQRNLSAEGTSSGATSASPRNSESPEPHDPTAPDGAGMTSAALAARNSQTGPHKCTRINPSTGKPCNTIFSRPYDLTRHEDTIHNGRKQKVRCPMCREEKTFSRNDALTRHMRVVHPEVEQFGKRGKRGG